LKEHEKNTEALQSEIEELKGQLFEANSIIDAIREGAVDALVLNVGGKAEVYSMESADYTYRILIEKFGEGALSISDDGLILYCNEYFANMIGLAPTLIIGTYFDTYFEAPEEFNATKDALKKGPSKRELVLNYGGKKVSVYVSLTDLNPTVAAIGVVVTDLTEKKSHEEALVSYQKELEKKVDELHQTNTNLEQFIHVISHDLKEPLRKILTYTSHLNANKVDAFAEDVLKSLNVINSSALRLNSLVDDLVKYAFSAAKDEENDVDLNKVLVEVLDDLELSIKENTALIVIEKLPEISGSKIQMRQLFSNLISNAIKYSKRDVKPEIKITAEIADGAEIQATGKNYYKICIIDNGIGMDSMHLSKIFTIFQRLHMRDEYSGNGIGLAICKKIMDNHQGKINVESKLENGSIFNLYFPIK